MGAAVTVTNNLPTVTGELIPHLLLHGLNLGGERLLALSAAEVPLDIGTLLGSGQVVQAETIEEGAAVVYDTPYAARLHEHPEYNFQNGRKGKYLEDPALDNRAEIGAVIAKGAQL
jgi:hypothetical protein